MSRNYVAFISYRHLPLDHAVAKRLHRQIERWVLPKEHRTDGRKHLGIVFRDQDELPLSSNLTQSIFDALDHSEFLIVICTPDTPKSLWVDREIEYFIKRHDRDHVLIVLADGTPDESVPRRLTEVYDAEGNITGYVEPLCANLLSTFKPRWLKKIHSSLKLRGDEFLRLAATILSVPFDSLKQRAKRRQSLIRNVVLGAVIAILTAFAAVLTGWNMEVTSLNQNLEEQFRQAQINETNALTLLSTQQLADGDRMGALESALNALPHDGDDRPYSVEAEYALSKALHAYGNGNVQFDRIITQENNIHMLSVSDDGKYVVTVDETGCLFCFDLLTSKQMWSVPMEKEDGYRTADDVLMLEILDQYESVFYCDDDYTYILSLSTGEILYKIVTADYTADDYYSNNDGCSVSLSQDESVFTFYPTNKYITKANTLSVFTVYRTKDLEPIKQIDISCKVNYFVLPPCLSADGKLISLFVCEYWPLQDHKIFTKIVDIDSGETVTSYALDNVYFNRDDVAANVTWLADGSALLQYLIEPTMTEHQMNFYHWTGQEDLSFYSRQVLTITNTDTDCNLVDVLTTEKYVFYLYSSYIVSVSFDGGVNDLFSSDLEIEYSYDISADSLAGWYIDPEDHLVLIHKNGDTEVLTGYSALPRESKLPDLNLKICQTDISPVSETICLIPDTAQNAIYVLRSSTASGRTELADVQLIANHKTTEQIHVALSPDGKSLMTFDGDTLLQNDYALTVYDTTSFEEIKRLSFTSEEYGLNFSCISSDSTKLYLYNNALDLSTGELSALPGTVFPLTDVNTEPLSFTQVNWSPAHKELIWQKGDEKSNIVLIPEDIQQKILNSCEETGPKYPPVYGNSGLIVGRYFAHFLAENTKFYLIYSIADDEWQLIDNPSPSQGVSVISVGATNKWIAFADYDQVLRIYDFDAETIIREYPLSRVSPEAVMQVQFILDDQVVLIVESTGILTAISTTDGTILGRFTLDVRETEWVYHYDCESPQPITFQVDEVHNDLYVGSYNGRTGGLRIDLDTWSVLADIPSLICYIPENNHIIQFDAYYKKLYACPVYSIEELIAQGNALLRP